ncbi:hypothetical protein [Aurantibacter sp.]|uniref:hypothetical protein n=1 Tax=Aurantibacter sp. TaxID=2807103 RepID=UPI0032664B56
MTGLHVISHSDDENEKESCTICDHAIANSLTPTISSDLNEFEIENSHFFIDSTITTNYSYIVSNTILARALFSRPPPFSI